MNRVVNSGRSSETHDSRRTTLAQLVNKQPAPQLRLEPCALRRHDLARIRHRDELVHRGREHGECQVPSRRSSPAARAPPCPDPADEVDPLVGAGVGDPEDRAAAPGPAAATRPGTPIGSLRSMLAWSMVKALPRALEEERERRRGARAGVLAGSRRPERPSSARNASACSPLRSLHDPVVWQDRAAASDGNSTARNQLYSSSPVWPGFAARRSWPARHALAERWCPSAT